MATMHSSVLARLGPRIVDGRLPTGSVLTLERIGEEFGVSRTVAREVVQVLVSMRLVSSRRRTGITVLPQGEWDMYDPAVIRWRLAGPARSTALRQLTQLRSAVEPPAAALAARNADAHQRRRVAELAVLLESTGAEGDLRTFLEYDVDFHRLLLAASANAMFAGLAEVVETVLRGRTDLDLMPPRPKAEARRLHAVVAEAVTGGEPEVARAAMSAICAEVGTEMERLVTQK
ncbi:MAG: FadR/GntR family transcriptional regulator [Nocardioidaceae bacterium]